VRVKLYLDTSVLGALTDPGPEDRIALTRRLLDELRAERWEAFVSTLVLVEIDGAAEPIRKRIADELARTPVTVLEETSETIALAHSYVAAGAIPADAETDARHIAVAVLNDIRVVVSWNFRHMVNIERKRRINSVNVREGLPLLDIVSPWEVGHEEG